MNKNCVVTVTSYRWLPRAFVMAESVLQYNPDCDVIILVPDMSHEKITNVRWPVSPSVRIVGFDEVRHPALQKMHVYFNTFELACAAKIFLVKYAIYKTGYTKVVLLDPDIMCYDSLNLIWFILEQADMAVTPHVNSPLPLDGHLPDDREFVYMGFINAGFWAVAKTDGARKSLDWMMDKVTHFGFFAPHVNLNADQTWMSCLPWYFPDGTTIIRTPGMNVAYWNLHERQLSKKNGEYFCNDEKLIFFHFSGYDEKNPDQLTMHTKRRFDHETECVLSELLKDYENMLDRATKSLPRIEPDLPCCDLPLEKRIKLYRNVYGENARLIPELESVPLITKVAKKIKRTINSLYMRVWDDK